MMEFVDSEDESSEPRKFVAEKLTNKNPEDVDTLQYRVSVTTKEEALQWLRIYQKQSRTHWIVDKTFPHPERWVQLLFLILTHL